MTSEREESRHVVDDLADDEVPSALAAVRPREAAGPACGALADGPQS